MESALEAQVNFLRGSMAERRPARFGKSRIRAAAGNETTKLSFFYFNFILYCVGDATVKPTAWICLVIKQYSLRQKTSNILPYGL